MIVTSPVANSNVTSPVNVVGTSDDEGCVNVQVWEGSIKYGYQIGKTLNASYPMTPGVHHLIVESVDSNTQPITKTDVTFTVGATGPNGMMVTSPVPNSTVESPVNVVGSSSDNGCVNIQVWEGSTKYGYEVGKALNASYRMTPGVHNLIVESVDSNSQPITKTNLSFTVAGASTTAPPPPGCVIPEVPSSAASFLNIQDVPPSGWKQPCTGDCSVCPPTNPNCGAPNANYTWGQVTTPSLSGKAMAFNLQTGPVLAKGAPWTSAVWAYSFGNQDKASNFLADYYFQISNGNPQALEWDYWQAIGGVKYMAGSQCVYATGEYDGWNEVTGHWVNSSATCPAKYAPSVWHHVRRFWQRTNGNVVYSCVQFDGGTSQNMALTEPGSPNSGWGDSAGVQFQLDYNYSTNPAPGFSFYLDDANFYVW
jgi:hypothetical protein